MRPAALEIVSGDFALATGHRHQLRGRRLEFRGRLLDRGSSGASNQPDRFGDDVVGGPADRLRRSWFLSMRQVSAAR
jgi:hypothetical protein